MEIYKTTNIITGEYYIGLNTTSNSEYLGSGVEIKKQLKEYGKENFIKEILCLVTSSSTDKDILRKIEHAYIANHISNKMCINKSIGFTKGANEVIIKHVEVEKIKYVDREVVRYKKRPPSRRLAELLNDEYYTPKSTI